VAYDAMWTIAYTLEGTNVFTVHQIFEAEELFVENADKNKGIVGADALTPRVTGEWHL